LPTETLDADLVQFISGIYDAVIDPGLWPDICDRIRSGFDFFNSELTVIGLRQGTVITNVAVNIPQDLQHLRTPEGVGEVVEMWGGAARMEAAPLEEPMRASDNSDPATWMQYKIFREYAVPQGIVDLVAIPLARDRELVGSIGFAKHKSSRPVTQSDFARLRAIAPHFRRAVIISGILNEAMNTTATFSAALDATPTAVVVVDEDLRIVHANAVAQPMLIAGDPILGVAGRLELVNELVPGQLAVAVRCVGNEAALGRRGLGIPARRRDGSPVTVTVMPLEQRSLRGGVSSRAAAAILIAESEPLQLPADALSLFYDLTPAEVRVFELVVEGRSNSDAAKALSVSLSTVKSHMVRVLEKTGVHNRVGLANLAHKIKLPG
jgi:DNA-binding NarL/FixJ family response regulator